MSEAQLTRQAIRVIIAGLVPAEGDENKSLIEEIKKQIESRGAILVATFIQRRGVSRANKVGGSKMLDRPLSPATIIGRGKTRELAGLVGSTQAEIVIFCNPLKLTQQSNLEKAIKARVIVYTDFLQDKSSL